METAKKYRDRHPKALELERMLRSVRRVRGKAIVFFADKKTAQYCKNFLDPRQLGDGILDVLEGKSDRRVGLEGQPPGQHLEEDYPQSIDVGVWADIRSAFGLLGAHVRRGSDHRSAGERGGCLRPLDDAEIRQIGLAVGIEEDIRRFDVAMDHASPVSFVQRGRDPASHSDALRHGQRGLGQLLAKRTARHEAHDQVGLSLFLSNVIDRDDRRMLEARDGLGLALEPGAEFRIVKEIFGEDFEGDLSVEDGVAGSEDHRHAAAP